MDGRNAGLSSVGRTAPANVDAERSTLGGVLLKKGAFDEVGNLLSSDDFYLPAHREIFEAMRAIDKRGQPIDLMLLSDELRMRGATPRLEGGEAYLTELAASVFTVENIGHYARIVKEKSTLRRLISTCAEVQSRAYGEFGDYEEFLDEAEKLIFDVSQRSRNETYSSLGDHMNDVLNAIEARARDRRSITGVPTGFTKFDELTAGLQPETLIVVAARPGMGKTSWAVNVAINAALNHQIPVLIFSLEMSKYELMERMLSGEARIDSNKIKRGFIEYREWKEKIYPAGARLAKAPLVIDDSPSQSILDIRAKARRFRADTKLFPPPPPGTERRPNERPLGLIVIDYLQLARGSGGKQQENREREIAEISRGLKALAKDLKLPIIAVSQLNRGLEKREDKKPQLSDLRESGAIEQDADMILFIHREEMYNTEGATKGAADLIVGKHRAGATGDVKMSFIKEFTRFENYVEDEGAPFE
jgi:replicative DNA helicase